ncbi:hypothetical protein OG233_14040 [Streptomyces sp. NBC_01218]|uniref:hypothetical protein n=1 Tax=Streptomyces sp. NBC_01218 TaxID=2903780 RepID=UPI002E130D61|nr:hypothetical protein OG233_14040 [Streptomyces sp. NBC_01218]
MITYHLLGFYGLFVALGGAALRQVLPRGSRAHRLVTRVLLAALLLITALVGLSY